MRAHWLDRVDEGEVLSAEALRADGLLYERLSVDGFRAPLEVLKGERGYVHEDEVALRPTTPGLDAICAKFSDEHLHDEDEVRYILEGEGIFDVRSRSDRYMRILVETDDLIVVPAQRYHRFLLTERRTIRAVRLFKDSSGWVPRYRAAS
ncbi:MAG TPA: cupin domain-containing protein [Polyangiaceae bacterium]|jgi:1,2-dihydroxy-3-keto-5-methylthiopentene dioxygenase